MASSAAIAPETEEALTDELFDDRVFVMYGGVCPICRVVTQFGKKDAMVQQVMQDCIANLHDPGVSPREEFLRVAEAYNKLVVRVENGRLNGDPRAVEWSFPVVRRHFRKCQNTGAEIVKWMQHLALLDADLRRMNTLVWQSDGERLSLDVRTSREREHTIAMMQKLATMIDARRVAFARESGTAVQNVRFAHSSI